MIKKYLSLFLFVFLTTYLPQSLRAEEFSTLAKQAVIIDYDTGDVLYAKNAEERMPTSSMSKTMTMYVVFDALKRGEIRLQDSFKVSEKAWKKGGSKMFVGLGDEVKIEDLIRGVVIQSGNDATIVLAEGLEGSEAAFADALNDTAEKLGMHNSNFMNASGWPDPNHYSTAHDLALLGVATIRDFPEYYPYYAEEEFTYNNIKQANRNPLLYRGVNADGIKTGHTEDGGYGLIGSGTSRGRRVVIVINGLPDDGARASESAKLLEWGLHNFENKTLFKEGAVIESVPVVMGRFDIVEAVVKDPVIATLAKRSEDDIKIEVEYESPLVAPIEAGTEIATMKILRPDMVPVSVPLFAAQAIEKKGFLSGTFSKTKLLISSKLKGLI